MTRRSCPLREVASFRSASCVVRSASGLSSRISRIAFRSNGFPIRFSIRPKVASKEPRLKRSCSSGCIVRPSFAYALVTSPLKSGNPHCRETPAPMNIVRPPSSKAWRSSTGIAGPSFANLTPSTCPHFTLSIASRSDTVALLANYVFGTPLGSGERSCLCQSRAIRELRHAPGASQVGLGKRLTAL